MARIDRDRDQAEILHIRKVSLEPGHVRRLQRTGGGAVRVEKVGDPHLACQVFSRHGFPALLDQRERGHGPEDLQPLERSLICAAPSNPGTLYHPEGQGCRQR